MEKPDLSPGKESNSTTLNNITFTAPTLHHAHRWIIFKISDPALLSFQFHFLSSLDFFSLTSTKPTDCSISHTNGCNWYVVNCM